MKLISKHIQGQIFHMVCQIGIVMEPVTNYSYQSYKINTDD